MSTPSESSVEAAATAALPLRPFPFLPPLLAPPADRPCGRLHCCWHCHICKLIAKSQMSSLLVVMQSALIHGLHSISQSHVWRLLHAPLRRNFDAAVYGILCTNIVQLIPRLNCSFCYCGILFCMLWNHAAQPACTRGSGANTENSMMHGK